MSRRSSLLFNNNVSGSYLFDLYTNGMYGFSFRQLSSDVTNCIRVRRSSDDAEQDFGFVSGELDIASLLSFVGANDGHIVKWYNQGALSFNFENTTGANEPKIVDSGSLVTDNGKPAIFVGSGSWLELDRGESVFPTIFSAFVVGQVNSVNQAIISSLAGSGYLHFERRWTTSGIRFRHASTQPLFPSYPTGSTQASFTMHRFNGSQVEFILNGSSDGNLGMGGSWSVNTMYLGNSNALVQEIVYFSEDKRTDSAAIITNQNGHYSIY